MRPKKTILIVLLILTISVLYQSLLSEKQSYRAQGNTAYEKDFLALDIKKLQKQRESLSKEIEDLKKYNGFQEAILEKEKLRVEVMRLEGILKEKEGELNKKPQRYLDAEGIRLRNSLEQERVLCKNLSAKLSEERKNNFLIKKELQTVKAVLNEKEKDIQGLTKGYEEIRLKNKDLEASVRAKEDQEKLLNDILREEKVKFENLKKEKENLLAQGVALKEESGNLRDALLKSTQKETGLYEKILAIEDMAKKISTDKETLQTNYNSLQAENEKLNAKIAEITEEKTKIEGEIGKFATDTPQLHKEVETLKAKLEEANKARDDLDNKYKEALAKNEALLNAVPGKEINTAVASVKNAGTVKEIKERRNKALVNGKIQASNNAYNFHIVNLGAEDGVLAGDIYYVLRDNKRIAEIEITGVREISSLASAYFIEAGEKIMVGDTVR